TALPILWVMGRSACALLPCRAPHVVHPIDFQAVFVYRQSSTSQGGCMHQDLLKFQVTKLSASAPEGVPVEWQGKEFSSGPLTIDLDENGGSRGSLDYARRQARAEFHVRLKFPEFADLLESLGVDPKLTQPVRAVLHSEGAILEDHSFALSGRCDLDPHGMLPRDETAASVLPGH